MKKRSYFFCLLGLILAFNYVSAQLPGITVSPQVQCYSAGTNTSMAYVSPIPAANHFSWTAFGPCQATIITFSNGAVASINYPCCGTYTLTAFAYSPNNVLVATLVQTSSVLCNTLSVAGPGTVCAGNPVTLSTSGASSYTWYTSQGTFTGSTIVLTPTASSCYSIVASSGSCASYGGGCITVLPGAGNPVISGNFNICAGSSTTLFASGSSSYTWLPGGSHASSLSVSPFATSCYTLLGTSCTGVGSAVRCVTVGSSPTLAVVGNTAVCAGQGATLTAVGAQSYTWLTSQGTFTGSTVVLTPTASTCYTLVGSSGGCNGFSGGCITVSQGSNPVISGNFNICAGGSTILQASGAQSYTWFPGGVVSSSILVNPSVTTCYTLAGFSPCGGVITAVRCVTVGAASPTVSVAGNNTVYCSGQKVVLSASGAQSYTWFTSMGTFTGATIMFTPTASMCYSFVASNGNNCNAFANGCVTVSPTPTITVTGSSVVCAGQPATLSASGAQSYFWYTSMGTFTGATIMFTPTATMCYTLGGLSGICNSPGVVGCVTVSPGSNPVISGNFNICQGSSTLLQASGAQSYTWFPGGIVSSSILVTPSVTTCYTLSGFSQCGGLHSAVRCVTVGAFSPTLTVTGNTAVCAGQSATLIAVGAQSYTWYTSQGTFSGSAIILTPTATTCYSLVGSSGNGCNGFAGGCITVSPGNNPVISGNFNICQGSSTILQASGAQNYTWFPGGVVSPSILVTPSVTSCYTLAGFGQCGGLNYAVRCVTVSPCCTVNISGNASSCAGSPNILTATGAQSYTWLPGNITGSTLTVSPLSSSCYTVIGFNQGCQSSAVKCISVISGPSIAVSGNSSMCAGSSTTLSASGATSYTWLPGNLHGSVVVVSPSVSTCYTVVGSYSNCVGLGYLCIQVTPKPVIVTSSGFFCAGNPGLLVASGASSYTWAPFGLTGSSISITPTVSGCYTVTGSNGLGCTSSVAACYSVLPSPVITITGNSTVCAGGSATLTASGATSYTWVPGFSFGPNLVVTPSVSSCYTVLASNSSGCISKAVKCITVQQGAFLNISGANIICAGTSANLLVSGALTYTWNSGSNSPFITVSPTVSTCYTVTGTTAGGCIGSAVKCLSVQPNPVITISGPGTICAGTSAMLTASGASSYTWSTGSSASFITVAPATSTVYTVVGNNGGCTGSASRTVIVNPRPNVYITRTDTIFNLDSIICAGEPVHLMAGGALSYTWSTGAHSQNIVVTPSTAISTYTVFGVNANGCSNSAVITLHVLACTGITKHSEQIQVGIYPNPSHGKITLQGDGVNKISYGIYDVLGRELLKGTFTNTGSVDLSAYTNGTYIIRFESGTITTYKKLILEK